MDKLKALPQTAAGPSGSEHRTIEEAPPCGLVGAIVGRLLGFAPNGMLFVDFPAEPALATVLARSCVAVTKAEVGRRLVLVFERADAKRAIVIGVLDPVPTQAAEPASDHVEIDAENLEFRARKSVSIKCGAASITLTHDGKVLIRGDYVQTRSSGVNRIQGGSVQIN